jgi:CHASE3 domain sensor protein
LALMTLARRLPKALAQFLQASAAFNGQIERLRSLSLDDPRRSGEMHRIDEAISRQFADFSNAIEVRKTQGYEGARALISLQATTASMAGLRSQVGAFIAVERQFLAQRLDHERRQEHRVILVGITVAIVSVIVRIGIALWLRKISS